MTTDWASLMPHAPLRPESAEYVARTDSASAEITRWLLADRSPVLLGGPTGVGKSTELMHAMRMLDPHRLTCLLPLDRWENMRRLSADQMLRHIARNVEHAATEQLQLPLSGDLKHLLGRESRETSPAELARLVLAEVGRLSRHGRITLLFDGLEKVPEGKLSAKLFDALAALSEQVELVVVIPYHAAFGPRAETILRAGERYVAARALEVEGDAGRHGRTFLREVLHRRLQQNGSAFAPGGDDLIDDAAMASGGIPRTFLQLMADAASYAKQHRRSDSPDSGDLRDAIRDQVDTFRRLLLPGDASAARAAIGTDGRELTLSRKVRLMSHGILLERVRNDTPVLEMHPLAQVAIEQGDRHA